MNRRLVRVLAASQICHGKVYSPYVDICAFSLMYGSYLA